MIDDSKALVTVDAEIIQIGETGAYDDALAAMGAVADAYASTDSFKVYHQTIRHDTTKQTQLAALKAFSAFLAQAGIVRTPEQLYQDAEAWRGMSFGIVKAFRIWLENSGFAIGTINHRISTVRTYCKLAQEAGVLSSDALDKIMLVKGYGRELGETIDESRALAGKSTRVSNKKATPSPVEPEQALTLKEATTRPNSRRVHDTTLEARDALLMGLLIEHALRVSEVAGLNIENIRFFVEEGKEKAVLTFYRRKTRQTEKHELEDHTRDAAKTYLATLDRKRGPLFIGYAGKRITRQGIYDRVRLLGKQVGIDNLSPHDLRHFWTRDALANGTSLDHVQAGGGWSSPAMVLKYAKVEGIANAGVKITKKQKSSI